MKWKHVVHIASQTNIGLTKSCDPVDLSLRVQVFLRVAELQKSSEGAHEGSRKGDVEVPGRPSDYCQQDTHQRLSCTTNCSAFLLISLDDTLELVFHREFLPPAFSLVVPSEPEQPVLVPLRSSLAGPQQPCATLRHDERRVCPSPDASNVKQAVS